MRQQISNRDWPLRRNGRDVVPVADGDRCLCVAGDETANRIVDPDLSFLDEDQNCGTRNRLGLRRDAEDGVRRHAAAGFLVVPAECTFVHCLAIAQHERNETRHFVFVNVPLEAPIDAIHAIGRQPSLGIRRHRRRGDPRAG